MRVLARHLPKECALLYASNIYTPSGEEMTAVYETSMLTQVTDDATPSRGFAYVGLTQNALTALDSPLTGHKCAKITHEAQNTNVQWRQA